MWCHICCYFLVLSHIVLYCVPLGVPQELPQEYNRFARVDKSYMKMMKRAYETKNVLQVCKKPSHVAQVVY